MPALLSPPCPAPAALTLPPATSTRRRLLRQNAMLGCFTLVFLLLRVCYAFVQTADTDEPQHLHVAWGWTQGLLPYRDFFDNHSPLFGMLCAPLLRLLGERADVVTWMRLAMVPLTLVGLGCVCRVSRCLFTRSVARWTPLLAGLFPPFFFPATEFRTDALWCVLWLAAVAVLVRGRLTPTRSLVAGLLLGTALAVSMKTVLMLAALGMAAAGTFGLRRWTEGSWPWRRAYPRALLAGILGMALVPGIVAGFFAAQGAWGPLVACTVGHNDPASAATAGSYAALRRWLFPVALLGLTSGALGLLRSCAGPRGVRRAFVLLAAGAYGALLVSFWPALTRQNFLPLYPLAAVPVVAAGRILARRLGNARGWTAGAAWWLPGAVAVLEVAGIIAWEPPWISHGQGAARQIGAVLRLTDPGEFVMDAKGASVFRPRPYYPVLESLTLRQFKLGRRRDDIVETLVATRTAVVIRAGLTERATAFVDANYLPVGSGVGAAGKWLPGLSPDGEIRFEVLLPARYVLISRGGTPAAGQLDGQPCDGQPRELPAGPHRFRPDHADDGPAALFWAQAYGRGFRPVANWWVKYVQPDRGT